MHTSKPGKKKNHRIDSEGKCMSTDSVFHSFWLRNCRSAINAQPVAPSRNVEQPDHLTLLASYKDAIIIFKCGVAKLKSYY